MLTGDDFAQVQHAQGQGMSLRQIARTFGHCRKTIRKALDQPEPKDYTLCVPRNAPGSKPGIDAGWKRPKGRHCKVRLDVDGTGAAKSLAKSCFVWRRPLGTQTGMTEAVVRAASAAKMKPRRCCVKGAKFLGSSATRREASDGATCDGWRLRGRIHRRSCVPQSWMAQELNVSSSANVNQQVRRVENRSGKKLPRKIAAWKKEIVNIC